MPQGAFVGAMDAPHGLLHQGRCVVEDEELVAEAGDMWYLRLGLVMS